MLPVQTLQHVNRLLLRQRTIDPADPAHTLLKRRRNKNADMGNPVVGQDHIGAPSHDHKILLLCHLTKQVALVEENSILL